MKFLDIEEKLPNRFHDSYIRSINIDYQKREVSLKLDLWIGNLDSEKEIERECWREGELTIKNFFYFIIEPPHPKYEYFARKEIWMVDLDEIEKSELPENVPKDLPSNASFFRGFISNFNSFLYFSNTDFEFKWVSNKKKNHPG